jgi:hypothetical protein
MEEVLTEFEVLYPHLIDGTAENYEMPLSGELTFRSIFGPTNSHIQDRSVSIWAISLSCPLLSPVLVSHQPPKVMSTCRQVAGLCAVIVPTFVSQFI